MESVAGYVKIRIDVTANNFLAGEWWLFRAYEKSLRVLSCLVTLRSSYSDYGVAGAFGDRTALRLFLH